MSTIEDVLIRLRAEFVEMPGLRLTPKAAKAKPQSRGRVAQAS